MTGLLLRSGQGDETAFAGLFDIFYPVVHAATAANVRSEHVQQTVQEIFLAIWVQCPTYRPADVSPVGWTLRHVDKVLWGAPERASGPVADHARQPV